MNPVASVEIQARSRGLAGQLREARAQFGQFADGVAAIMMRGMKKSQGIFGKGGIGQGILQGVGQNLSNRALGAVEDAAQSVRSFEEGLTRFGIAARKTPEELDAIRRTVKATAKEFAMAPTDVLAAARAYVDLAGAEAFTEDKMRLIARTSKSTGAAMGDITTVMYSLQDAAHVTDAELESTLSGLVNQSKDGSIHFNQLAGEIIGLMPQFARFGVIGRKGAIEIGALMQVARSGFGSASETATGLQSIFRGLGLHADRFAQAGVKVFNISKDGTKTFRPIATIFDEISHSILAKNPDFLMKAFGRGTGEMAYNVLSKHVDKLHEMEQAGEATNTIQEDLDTYMTSSAGRIEKAMNNAKLALLEAFTPERIKGFADALEGVAAKLSPIIDGVGKIGGFLGSLYGVGRSVRGFISGTDAATYDMNDLQLDNAGGYQLGSDNSAQARAARLAGARSRIAGVEQSNAAAKAILGAEIDEKSSPESIRQAFAAKYGAFGKSTESHGIGSTYLRNAGVEDPIEKAIHTMYQISAAGQAAQLRAALKDAVFNVVLQIDGKEITKAHKASSVHHQGVSK